MKNISELCSVQLPSFSVYIIFGQRFKLVFQCFIFLLGNCWQSITFEPISNLFLQIKNREYCVPNNPKLHRTEHPWLDQNKLTSFCANLHNGDKIKFSVLVHHVLVNINILKKIILIKIFFYMFFITSIFTSFKCIHFGGM